MERRLFFPLLAFGGLALSEALPRLAWRSTISRDDGDIRYPGRLNFLPAPEDQKSAVTWDLLEVQPAQVAGLAYHRAQRYLVRRAPGVGMELLYLEYEEGNPRYFEDLFYHLPQRCMAAVGTVENESFRHLTIEGTAVEVRCVTFREWSSNRLLYIYKAIWLHKDFPVTMGSSMHWKKVQAALAVKTAPPARMLMAAVLGVADEEAAWKEFRTLGLSRLRPVEAAEKTSGTSTPQ